MPRYHQIKEGDWEPIKARGFRLMCCDCGMTHSVDVRYTEAQRYEMRFRIDKRATSASRRRFKFDD